ncbi:MAG TPA: TnsD family Tn7-like transposition protein [Verrucomicrobiae bacterium]
MIAYFPDPYPDELWYSVCARFSDRMKFGTETGTMQALYGSRHAIATVDLPHRLGALVCQLPPGHRCTVDTIIDQHTFLPYYSRFLTTSTYAKARDWMGASTKAGVRVKCGACTNRVRPPKYFRSCPECDRENRENLGEAYWRRLFQLPGVEVCPIHEVFLKPSDIRLDPLPNRHKYYSAEAARLGTKVHRVDREDRIHRILLDLARGIDWLLRQERLNPGLEFLHARYQAVLAEKTLATRAGSIRMAELRAHLIRFYGPKLLELLQCALPGHRGDGWLGHLLRKADTAVAPLRHLLLLTALDIDLGRFFETKQPEQPAQKAAAPAGLWPCLNPVCEDRGKPLVKQLERVGPDSNGTEHVIIRCPHCGFAYELRDSAEPPTRATRVVDYGATWKNVLRQLWADTSITLRHMAKMLGVDPKTVKQRAIELGLRFPRPGKRPVTKRGLYVPKPRDPAKQLEEHRRAWMQLRTDNSAAGTKALRALAPALYPWLYRCDQVWLKAHQPVRLPPTVTRVHVDWAKRDEELAGEVATAAHQIRLRPGKPRQVTTTAIGRVLGKQSLFEAALAKLPLTHDVITHVIESGVDFAVRRVHAAAARLRRTQGSFARCQLVRAAGLHHRLEREPRVAQALDYEMRPPVNVIILRDGDPMPPRALRFSTKVPRRIRPLAIVQPTA